ncbi:metal-dependent amidase/aminoacylase/carboxypeptidase family protein [Virgibacillus halotolerans]|uniref:hypothetical protein n=1 Tax=Virgibacillus halotolerans TaxID=1071053 RepID=UPI001960272A|nr:hypothetical protein [Virgibacillus halotolerans]MBM7600308.1 metal-dependent amidase/aminoacylase/carboxypeptidase family protein [Virgibacillus halotolerans]
MKTTIEKLTPYLKTVFNHLHSHPKISWEGQKTTAYIQSLFEQHKAIEIVTSALQRTAAFYEREGKA